MTDFFDYAAAGDESESGPDVPAEGTFLAGCSSREWRTLQQHSTVEVVGRGEALVRQGDTDRSLFIVLTGAFAPSLAGTNSSRVRLRPGDVFGEIAFFDGLPRSSTVVALEESRVMRIRHEAFEALSASAPALARTLLMDLGRALAGRLRAAQAGDSPR
jgi:CRP/FNR family transcriptional regulator, cyclic AMP receptor protein